MFEIENIFDQARGVFQDWLDFDLKRQSLSLAKEAQAADQRQQAAAAPQVGITGINTGTLLTLAVVGVGGIFLIRALR